MTEFAITDTNVSDLPVGGEVVLFTQALERAPHNTIQVWSVTNKRWFPIEERMPDYRERIYFRRSPRGGLRSDDPTGEFDKAAVRAWLDRHGLREFLWADQDGVRIEFVVGENNTWTPFAQVTLFPKFRVLRDAPDGGYLFSSGREFLGEKRWLPFDIFEHELKPEEPEFSEPDKPEGN